MDDLITGGDTVEEIQHDLQGIVRVLKEYGFPLRKWCTNDKIILKNIEMFSNEINFIVPSEDQSQTKALGVTWQPKEDEFLVHYKGNGEEKMTKRSVLSNIARLFDPLGFITPIVVRAKILMQELWKAKIDWDEKLPIDFQRQWLLLRNELQEVKGIRIKRKIKCDNPVKIEMHGFCDASMKAYGAVVYLKTVDAQNNTFISLVASKSRVAPAKTQTLPKLELCAAVLLVNLVEVVLDSLRMKIHEVWYYSDSEIVLKWLHLDAGKLHIFVSNRVSQIQAKINVNRFCHVATEQNPADLVSRGMSVNEVRNNKLWLEGPPFLKQDDFKPEGFKPKGGEHIPEMKKMKLSFSVLVGSHWIEQINHRNNFNFLLKVMSKVYKIRDVLLKRNVKTDLCYFEKGLVELIKFVQNKHFYEEIKDLRKNKNVNNKSKLATLSPFIDEDNIIRVGGRIQNSQLEYDTRHPIVLPYQETFVVMLVQDLHVKHLHIGPQGLLAISRQKYWLLRGRQLTRKIVNQCYRCFRLSPRPLHQLMGNLPQDRLVGTRPFLTTGIDFFGPINIHHKLRGKRIDKSYGCVFVCFATKAVHLEIVSDLSSAAFLGALTRFVARRSSPEVIYSDNGTNFKGAANSLQEIFNLWEDDNHREALNNFCVQKAIQWKFIPARSPHIGGLWEAAVKAVKRHFHKAVEGTLTLEQLSTIMTQIEAVLNSRPLTPMSNDPRDFSVLTPGHFLVGGPLTTLVNRASNQCYHGIHEHWKMVERNVREFWNRWSNEYLTELQKRFKWRKAIENIEPNTLVLLKDDNLQPMNWRRGRIIKCIVGKDKICRMVEVQTSTGVTIRSVHNICPFPTEDDHNRDKTDKGENVLNETNVKDNNTPLRRSVRIKNKNCITTLLLMLMVMPIIKAEGFIKLLNDNSGILYENQGTVGLVRSHWDLILHADMSAYWAYNKKIKEIFDELFEMTKRVQDEALLSSAVEHLQNKFERIQQNNRIIEYRQSKRSNRMPRAPLQFVGSIFHAVFGLMDAEHAELLEEGIKRSQANEDYMIEMLKQNANFQNVTRTILRSQNSAVWKNFNVINKTVYSLTEAINKRVDVDMVLAAIADCSLVMETLETMQNDIIAFLWTSKINFIEKILTIEEFQQQIKKMTSNMNKDVQLPVLDPMILGETATITTRITNSTLLFNLRFPLIAKEKMTVFVMHSYPTWHDGYFVSIEPRFKYALINSQRTRFGMLSEAQFHQCNKIEDLWLCPLDVPVYHVHTDEMCEISLLFENKMNSNCNIKIGPPTEFWQQLLEPSDFIFSVHNESAIHWQCGTANLTEVISGQGLVQVKTGCTLRTTQFHYTAYRNIKTEAMYLWPVLNLSRELPSLNHVKVKGEMQIYKIPDIPTSSNPFNLPTHWNLDYHDVFHYSISFTTLIILIVTVGGISCILRRLCAATKEVMPVAGFIF